VSSKKLKKFAVFCIFITFAAEMKQTVVVILSTALVVLVGCAPSVDQQSAELMADIEQLYAQGKFRATLDSIEMLRMRYPRAVEARKRALVIWNDASLKMAQADIAVTDSALTATESLMEQETEIFKHNMLGVKRDSLKARYEALCGVVRMIRLRQQEK